VSTTLANDAPTRGQPFEVIGPISPEFQPGEDVAYLSVYCSPGCGITGATANGKPENPQILRERELSMLRSYLRIPSGTTATLTDRLALPRAWEGSTTGGVYRLRFLNQTTIRPTRVQIVVTVPKGMSVTGTGGPMKVSGRRAVWTGIPGRELSIEVRFAPPLPQRVWRGFLKFLSKPLVHF
jgi:hypothetical protein